MNDNNNTYKSYSKMVSIDLKIQLYFYDILL